MEYLDLILLHPSLSDYYGSWRALEEENEEANKAGRNMGIVCGMRQGHLDE